MRTFDVIWKVEEVVNGPGEHDDGRRDGQRTVVARGHARKEAETDEELRSTLSNLLKKTWPPMAMGPTYDLVRNYLIEINEVPST